MNFLTRIFGGKRKPAASTNQNVNLVGQPHYMNLPPSDSRAIARHLARIRACRQVLNTDRDSNAESLQTEITRRTTLLGLVGVTVPDDDAELNDLINQYGG